MAVDSSRITPLMARRFLSAPTCLLHCIIGCIVSQPTQAALFYLLKHESLKYPELAKSMQQQRDQGESQYVMGQSVVLELAQGNRIGEFLKVAAATLVPSGRNNHVGVELPAHIAGFRHLFCQRGSTDFPSTAKHLWRALIGGVAQMWFRLFYSFTKQWPYMLLLLISDVAMELMLEVINNFLFAAVCCMDAGFTRVLRHLVDVNFVTVAEKRAFMLSNYIKVILLALAKHLSASIADIECFNAVIKRFGSRGGKQEYFSSMCARAIIHEAISLFKRVHHRSPTNIMSASKAAMDKERQHILESSRKKGRRLNTTTGYNQFVDEQFQLHRDTTFITDVRAEVFQNMDLRSAISAKWHNLEWHDKSVYEVKAANINAERARGNAAACTTNDAGSQSALKCASGDNYGILTAGEAEFARTTMPGGWPSIEAAFHDQLDYLSGSVCRNRSRLPSLPDDALDLPGPRLQRNKQNVYSCRMFRALFVQIGLVKDVCRFHL